MSAGLKLLEHWEPNAAPAKLTRTEKKLIERVGKTIAAKTLAEDIPYLITASTGRVPRDIYESQIVNYIQGVFDMAAARIKNFTCDKSYLRSRAIDQALSCLQSGEVAPNPNSFNTTGPRLRLPGQDWSRF